MSDEAFARLQLPLAPVRPHQWTHLIRTPAAVTNVERVRIIVVLFFTLSLAVVPGNWWGLLSLPVAVLYGSRALTAGRLGLWMKGDRLRIVGVFTDKDVSITDVQRIDVADRRYFFVVETVRRHYPLAMDTMYRFAPGSQEWGSRTRNGVQDAVRGFKVKVGIGDPRGLGHELATNMKYCLTGSWRRYARPAALLFAAPYLLLVMAAVSAS